MKLVVMLIVLLMTAQASAADRSITLSWDPNSEKDLAGYKVFYKEFGVASFNYTSPIWEGVETTCKVTVPGDGEFVARAFDLAGNESADSKTAVLDLPPGQIENLLIDAIDLVVQALGKLKEALAYR